MFGPRPASTADLEQRYEWLNNLPLEQQAMVGWRVVKEEIDELAESRDMSCADVPIKERLFLQMNEHGEYVATLDGTPYPIGGLHGPTFLSILPRARSLPRRCSCGPARGGIGAGPRACSASYLVEPHAKLED